MLALFMTSLTQTAEHKLAALVVTFSLTFKHQFFNKQDEKFSDNKKYKKMLLCKHLP